MNITSIIEFSTTLSLFGSLFYMAIRNYSHDDYKAGIIKR